MDLNGLEEQKRKLELERDIRRMELEKAGVGFVAKYKWGLIVVGLCFLWVLFVSATQH